MTTAPGILLTMASRSGFCWVIPLFREIARSRIDSVGKASSQCCKIDEAKEQRVGKKESRSPHSLFSKTRRKRKKRKVEPLPRSGVHITTMRAISHPKRISLRRPSCWHFPFSQDLSSFFHSFTKVSGTVDSILKHG